MTSKKRVTLTSQKYGAFDLDELVDRLCHSHASKPREEDLYNAQVAILKLADVMRQDETTDSREALGHDYHPTVQEALYELVIRCQMVKKALDAGLPDGPVHPQSAALTWPLSSAMLALQRERTPVETTSLTEAEELLKAWADPQPPNGGLYWAHVEKAREYFHKRLAVEPEPTPADRRGPERFIRTHALEQLIKESASAIPGSLPVDASTLHGICIELRSHRERLYGADSPEAERMCKHDDGDCHEDDPCETCPIYRRSETETAKEKM